jgi:hypothetical protein
MDTTTHTLPRQPATTKVNHRDNFEDVYLRHAQLRRSPNPPNEKLKQALPLIKKTANNIYYKNKQVLSHMGFDREDLINIGLVHAISFLASQEIMTHKGLFVNYLKQRYYELIATSKKKQFTIPVDIINENCVSLDDFLETYLSENTNPEYEIPEQSIKYVMGDIVHVLNLKQVGLFKYEFYLDNILITHAQAESIINQLDNNQIIPNQYHTNPKSIHTHLDKLDPVTRAELLVEAANNPHIAPEARTFAKQLCNTLICPNCSKKVMSGLKCLDCNVTAVPKYATTPPARQAHNLTKAELKQMSKTLSEELMAKLPDYLNCGKCKQLHPKSHFGIRVAKNKITGLPYRASKQSYCRACRKSNT